MNGTRRRTFALAAALAAAGLLLAAGQTSAADPTSAAPLLAERVTFRGFIDYWIGWANSTSRVLQIVSVVGAIAIAVIVTGKWKNN